MTTTAIGRAKAFLVGIGAVGVLVALSLRKLADFDLPGHLAVGRMVVQHAGPVLVDELSAASRPIGYVEYVSDVGLYLLDRAGGPALLQLGGGALAVAVGALLVRGGRPGGAVTYAVTALALAAMQPWLLTRPASVSFVMLAALMVTLGDHARSTAPRRLFFLIPAFALWANIHGFVVIGLAVLFGYVLCAALCRVARGRLGGLLPATGGRELPHLGLVAAGSLLATMCNQAGPLLLTGPLRAVRDPGHVAEWASTTLTFLIHQAPLVLAFAVLVLLALALGREPGTSRRDVTLLEVGLVVLAFVLARSAVRLIPVAIILTAPLTAIRLGGLLPRASWLEIGCALSTWLVGPWMLLESPASRGVGFDPAHFSDGAIAAIEASRPRGAMYNTLSLGGWLDYRLAPRYRTFVDHRQAWVHDQGLLATYYASEHDPLAFGELDARFDFEWAVVFAAEGSRFALPIAESASWGMVFWDDSTAVYVKTPGPNASIAQRGYRILRHLTSPEDMLTASIARDAHAAGLAHDGRLAASQAPGSSRAAFFDGCGAIAVRDRGALDAAIKTLSRLAPGHAGIELLARGWDAAEAGMQ